MKMVVANDKELESGDGTEERAVVPCFDGAIRC